MADTDNNITIDVTGNTASMATDYGHSGHGLTYSHIPISKLVWGDKDNSDRVSLSKPFPIQFAGQTGPIEIQGKVSGQTGAYQAITNFIASEGNLTGNWGHIGYGTLGGGAHTHFVAVAGNTSGMGYGSLIAITGMVQGVVDGEPVAVTGDVRINGVMAPVAGLLIQGVSAGNTATVNGENFPGYGFGVPVAITGGRRLSSATDTVTVVGTINSTGGRQLGPLSDSVSVYGYDGNNSVHTILRASNDGPTAGYSGDALKVAIVNAAEGITFSISVSAVTGVTNASEPALRIQGTTGSAIGDPVTVRGQNNGALEIVSTAGLSTSVSNTVAINDTNITNSLESTAKPLISNLAGIKSNTGSIDAIKSRLESGKLNATITAINKPSDIRSGSKTVQSNAQTLHSNLVLKTGITVKASPNNSTNILIGNKSLLNNTSAGYLLEPGESIFLEVNNLSRIYVKNDGPTNVNNVVYYIGS